MRNFLTAFRSAAAIIFVVIIMVFSLSELDSQTSGWDHYQNAIALQANDQTDEAIAQLKKAIEIEPQNAFYFNAIGLSYIEAGDVDSAIENLSKAIELNDNLPEAYSGLGVCYNALGDFEKSIVNFTKAAELVPDTSPDMAVFYNNIGQNLYLLRKLDEAEKTLLQAVELNDKLLTAYINLGNVYTEKGDYENAVNYHKKAVELAPDYPLSRNNLAFAYFKLGDLDTAVAEMKLAVEAAPRNKQFIENLDFLRSEMVRRGKEVYSDGTLAGLPKEVHIRPGSRSAQEVEPEEPEETVAIADEPESTPETPETVVAVAEEPSVPETSVEEELTLDETAVAEPVEIIEEVATEEPATEPVKPVEVVEKPATEPVAETITAEIPSETPSVEVSEEEALVVAEVTPPSTVEENAYKTRERTRETESAPAVAAPVQTEPKTQPETQKQTVTQNETPAVQPAQKVAQVIKTKPTEVKTEEKVAEAPQQKPVTIETSESNITYPPSYERAQRKRGSILEDDNEAQAAADMEAASPELANDYYEGAKYNLKMGNIQEAKNDIQKALNINPTITNYIMVEAMVKERSGLAHEAALMYSKIASDDPKNSVAHNNLGHVNEILNRKNIAMDEYQKAYETDPTNGCAAGNYGSALAFEGSCDEAIDLLTKAIERNCATGSVLNNLAFCYFKKGDMTNAQQISYSALEKSPRDQTILSNFSLVAEKSDFNYMPIKVSRDTSVDPFYKLKETQKTTPLESLTPVETIDYYSAFENIYKPAKIVVVPFTTPQGTERWKPTPGQQNTEKLATALKNTGHLNVTVADPKLSYVSYLDKSTDAFLQETLDKSGADMIIAAEIGKNIVEDRTKSLFFGIKKKSFVDSTLPVSTKLVTNDRMNKIQDGIIEGKASAKNENTTNIAYSDMRSVKAGAFEDYCDQVTHLIMDHFNLIRYPVRKNVVKFLKSKPVVQPGYKR